MRLLLDTHAFLWWCAASPQLSAAARRAVSNADNEVFLSAVSGWEIAIKARLGKLPLPEKPAEFMAKMLRLHGFGVLNVTLRHSLADYGLPPHHADPFDRLLIAQAQLEGLTLVTNDAQLEQYGIETLW